MDNFQWVETKNRTIISGYPTEDTSLILEHLLRQQEIAPNWQCNVIDNLPPSLRIGAFKAGTGSFIVTEGIVAEKLAAEQVGAAVIALSEEIDSLPAAVYMTTPNYLDNHHLEMQKLVNGLHKAQQWIQYHSAEKIVNLIKGYFPEYDQQQLLAVVKKYKNMEIWSTNPVITEVSYENMYNIASNSGELAKKVQFAECINNRFAQKAIKEVHYVPDEQPKPGLNWRYIKSLFN